MCDIFIFLLLLKAQTDCKSDKAWYINLKNKHNECINMILYWYVETIQLHFLLQMFDVMHATEKTSVTHKPTLFVYRMRHKDPSSSYVIMFL